MTAGSALHPRSRQVVISVFIALGLALIASSSARRADVSTPWPTCFSRSPSSPGCGGPRRFPLRAWHLALLASLGACFWRRPLGSRRTRGDVGAVFLVGYALRATAWIVGGNLPLVPGDSCHYLEVATSIWRGEGPVKHYAESFFRDYKEIRTGEGVLDDWATPLQAYVLAGTYRVLGVTPSLDLEQTVAVAKGTSFVLSVLALPAIYGFGCRRFDRGVGLSAMALLAVLPVHVIYAGFGLRESLVALTSILAVWTLTEVWCATNSHVAWRWAVVAGVCGGLAILARNTALALMAGAGLFGLLMHGRRRLGPLLLWGLVLAVVIAPWAWVTYQTYGEPFHSYTNYFPYNFSWTVHHYEKGNTRAAEFYTAANAPEIVRVKIKEAVIIVVTSTMILSLPLTARAWCLRPRRGTAAIPIGWWPRSAWLSWWRPWGGSRTSPRSSSLAAIICRCLRAGACSSARGGRSTTFWRALNFPPSVRRWLKAGLTGRCSGPIRPGRMMQHGFRLRISFTGPLSARRGTGSRLIPRLSRRMLV